MSQICPRCGAKTIGTIMSKFNTEIICMDCKLVERDHPAYEAASRAEVEAVRAGDRNFPGVGKPPDLDALSRAARSVREKESAS